MKNSAITTPVLFVSLSLLLLFAVVVSNSESSVFAQSTVSNDVKRDTPGQPIKRDQAVHIDVNLALVNVTVTDPYNRLVTGLEPDNFRVFEDNVEQEVVNFSSEDVPISIGVILDLSGSMASFSKRQSEEHSWLPLAKPGCRATLPGWMCVPARHCGKTLPQKRSSRSSGITASPFPATKCMRSAKRRELSKLRL